MFSAACYTEIPCKIVGRHCGLWAVLHWGRGHVPGPQVHLLPATRFNSLLEKILNVIEEIQCHTEFYRIRLIWPTTKTKTAIFGVRIFFGFGKRIK